MRIGVRGLMALLVVGAAGCSSGPPAGEGILELNFTDVPDCEVRNGDICATTETRFSLEGPAEQVQFVSGSATRNLRARA